MEWMGTVEFQLMPVIGNVKGICRFYLKQTHPRFQLYVSPINIDPEDPACQFPRHRVTRAIWRNRSENSTRKGLRKIQKRSRPECSTTGVFGTGADGAGRASAGVRCGVPEVSGGVVLFLLFELDLNAHMMWRLTDPQSPAYDAALAAQYGSSIEDSTSRSTRSRRGAAEGR